MKRLILLILTICCSFGITCYASDITVTINSIPVEFDVPPIIKNERTLVPMRKIFEELGCEVEWLSESQTVIATHNSKIIALQIDKNKIITSDIETGKSEVLEIDTAPILYENKTLVPVRVISETLGYNVDWNNQSRTVIITK